MLLRANKGQRCWLIWVVFVLGFSLPLIPANAKSELTQQPNKSDATRLPQPIQKVLSRLKVPTGNISIYVRNISTGKTLISHNSNRLRTPASTIKLLTTYAALKSLGPNYTWPTEIWLRGKLEHGVLKGDLIIKGFGDPYLVREKFWLLLKSLRERGLKTIDGNIIIDNSYFDLPDHDPAAFDEKPFRIYNASPSALMYNFQATRFLFQPMLKSGFIKTKNNQQQGIGKVSVVPQPAISDFKFKNNLSLQQGHCRASHRRPEFTRNKAGKLTISGNYAIACQQQTVMRAISNPEEHVFNAFRELWHEMGGTLTGHYKNGTIRNGDKRFFVYHSPTLGELIRLINKWSNNVMTKQLLLTLGATEYGNPGTFQKGRQAVLNILAENGMVTQGIILENGSGLSRRARITAKQMANLLERAYQDAYMPEFISSLPVIGLDGTLRKRFQKSDLQGRGHLKTGTLDFVTSIAGYLLNKKGQRLVIVIQHTGKKAGGSRGKKIQDAILHWSFEH